MKGVKKSIGRRRFFMSGCPSALGDVYTVCRALIVMMED